MTILRYLFYLTNQPLTVNLKAPKERQRLRKRILNTANSVMIEKYSFGKIVVNGVTYANDIKIVQGRVVSDWWRKRGHSVGIEDIRDILESKPSVLVIGKGQPGMMRSSRSLRRFLKKNDIELIEEKTSQAITTYNSLLQQEKEVSAGFHVSC